MAFINPIVRESAIMSIHPIYAKQFGWVPNLPPMQLMADPELAARVRESFKGDPSYVPPVVATRELHIDGPLGRDSLRARVYSPTAPREQHPILVWVHGGGWIAGTIDEPESDWVARELVARAGITVITPDYALANGDDVTYPNLHREVLAAFEWATANATQLGGDPSHVVLGGASAGANLCAGAILEAKDTGSQLPAALVLAYPSLHRTELTEERKAPPLTEVPGVLRLEHPTLSVLYAAYTGSHADDAPYASIEGHDLAGLPPTLVLIDEYDDLRESGEVLIDELRAAGGTVTRYLAEGMCHGHLAMAPTIDETNRSIDVMAKFITARPAVG